MEVHVFYFNSMMREGEYYSNSGDKAGEGQFFSLLPNKVRLGIDTDLMYDICLLYSLTRT